MELGFVQVYQSVVLEKLVPEETRGAIIRTDNTTIQARINNGYQVYFMYMKFFGTIMTN